MPIMQITYSCKGCGIERRVVTVEHRKENENVVHWVRYVVGYRIAQDHKKKSPHCTCTSSDDVMIPMPKDPNKGIGMI